MAQYTVTSYVTEAIDAGATAAQFEEIGAELFQGDWIVWNRREQAAVERLWEQVTTAAQAAPVKSTEPMATEKQVAYILRLIKQGAADEGGFMSGPRDRAGVAALTRRQASAYIDSLTGRY